LVTGVFLTDDVYVIFKAEGKGSDDVEKYLAKLFLIASIISLLFCFFVGWLADRYTIWKLIFIMNTAVTLTYFPIAYDIGRMKISAYINVGFII